MGELQFIQDYRDSEQHRESFFQLANSVFGLKFKRWYHHGFWGNGYIPFSYVVDDKVVANVSINIIDLIIEGEQKRALQVGTVMTHPDYRNRGLSKSLMNKVLEEYEHTYDFMYLFANDSVLDFYPKFGFEIVDEYQFSINFSSNQKSKNKPRKLNITNVDDINFIFEFAKERIPVSDRFSTGNSQGILMYYCLNVFCNDIYYLGSEDVIIIFKEEENQIDIFDIISKQKKDINNILIEILGEGSKKIVFHYTPDYKGLIFESNLIKGDGTLFVKTSGNNYFPKYVKHPITSEA
ncbi:GNAT family N-acetyltransferase [Sporosarcina thermotolerans]|uniref:GNAT family N-acetyltransferase n=2 Tax=Sporosarcina thermotolerans TaxID=633404 RepID=A0AAW9A7M4_9BACL|nr:GNAT family N-acetyltransferase [Sporosarcina thermotolerans]MDW0117187.1 GNAT family N-acetyltransferase [Sporosarcina thermotolerans]